MKKGLVKQTHYIEGKYGIQGTFQIHFDNAVYGPYTYIFHRKNLYFNDETKKRGSYFFPLKTSYFNNTEIFLETNTIIIGLGERGSFSGKLKRLMEVINLKTGLKYRLYPEEVSLIYNAKDSIVIYYRKSGQGKKLVLDINKLEKISEVEHNLDAFFKILYCIKEQKFKRLYYIPNSKSHMAGYFEEQDIIINNKKKYTLKKFNIKNFKLTVNYVYGNKSLTQKIDVWESSITGKID